MLQQQLNKQQRRRENAKRWFFFFHKLINVYTKNIEKEIQRIRTSDNSATRSRNKGGWVSTDNYGLWGFSFAAIITINVERTRRRRRSLWEFRGLGWWRQGQRVQTERSHCLGMSMTQWVSGHSYCLLAITFFGYLVSMGINKKSPFSFSLSQVFGISSSKFCFFFSTCALSSFFFFFFLSEALGTFESKRTWYSFVSLLFLHQQHTCRILNCWVGLGPIECSRINPTSNHCKDMKMGCPLKLCQWAIQTRFFHSQLCY